MSLPLALQPLQCGRPDCTLPQGGRCAREAEFPDPVTLCTELARETARPRAPSIPPGATADSPAATPAGIAEYEPSLDAEPHDAEPWRGRHLSMTEASNLLRRAPARLVAVLGEHDAGKTCLLASFFLQLANGQRAPLPYRFASSLSLSGWRDFVDRARLWRGEKHREIIGHTPKSDEPDAGHFLHLGLRPQAHDDHRHLDVLLTDLQGEWIGDWAVSRNDTTRRRMPYLERADGFVVVIDAGALLSEGGAKLDSRTAALVRRVADAPARRARRGLSFVLSKFDSVLNTIARPPEDRKDRAAWGPIGKRLRQTWPALEHARARGLHVELFATSAFPGALDHGQPVNVVEPFAHVLGCADARERRPPLVSPVPEGASYFQSMRRWEPSP